MSTVPRRFQSSQVIPPPLPVRSRMVLPRAIPAFSVATPARSRVSGKKVVLFLTGAMAVLLIAIATTLAIKASSSATGVSHQGGSGSQATSGAVTGLDGFQLEYKLVERNQPSVEVTVKGRAVKLALLFTKPNKESLVVIINKEEMITNSVTRFLRLSDPDAGNYVLELKTLDPERTVCKKEFSLSLDELTVTDVKLKFESRHPRRLKGVDIFLRKKGNLPIEFFPVSASFNGRQIADGSSGGTMLGPTHTISICHAEWQMETRDLLREGEQCVVEGLLYYGEDRANCLHFRKELVVP